MKRKRDTAIDTCVVVSSTPATEAQARERALKLGLHFCESAPPKDQLALECGEEGLALSRGEMCFCPDFADSLPRLRQGALSHELLVRAAKVSRNKGSQTSPLAIDATAGLGEDSLLLAAAGFRVVMFEKDPIIAALLADCLSRAQRNEALASVVSRMTLYAGDAVRGIAELASGSVLPDVIYLDPMFPAKTKSAAAKKKFQLLHQLESPCENERELLVAAQGAHPQKVVVKRPASGPFLAGEKPSYSLRGKMIRFDIYAL